MQGYLCTMSVMLTSVVGDCYGITLSSYRPLTSRCKYSHWVDNRTLYHFFWKKIYKLLTLQSHRLKQIYYYGCPHPKLIYLVPLAKYFIWLGLVEVGHSVDIPLPNHTGLQSAYPSWSVKSSSCQPMHARGMCGEHAWLPRGFSRKISLSPLPTTVTPHQKHVTTVPQMRLLGTDKSDCRHESGEGLMAR